jgi:hypothetical protein
LGTGFGAEGGGGHGDGAADAKDAGDPSFLGGEERGRVDPALRRRRGQDDDLGHAGDDAGTVVIIITEGKAPLPRGT